MKIYLSNTGRVTCVEDLVITQGNQLTKLYVCTEDFLDDVRISCAQGLKRPVSASSIEKVDDLWIYTIDVVEATTALTIPGDFIMLPITIYAYKKNEYSGVLETMASNSVLIKVLKSSDDYEHDVLAYSDTKNIYSRIGGLTQEIRDYEDKTEDLEDTRETKEDAEAKNSAMDARVTAIENDYLTSADKTELEDSIADNVSTLNERIDNLQPSALEERVSANETNISTNTANISTNKTNISTNTSDISKIKTRLDNLDKTVVYEGEIEDVSDCVLIPDNTLDYVSLDKLGSITYQSENILDLINVPTSTVSGVSYTVKDGIITLNGTCTGTAWITLKNKHKLDGISGYHIMNDFRNRSDENYQLRLIPWTDGNKTARLYTFITNKSKAISAAYVFNSAQTDYIIQLYIESGVTYDNLVLKPMMVKGNVAPTKFKPYSYKLTTNTLLDISHTLYDEINVSSGDTVVLRDEDLNDYDGGNCDYLKNGTLVTNAAFPISVDWDGTFRLVKLNPVAYDFGNNLVSNRITGYTISDTGTMTENTSCALSVAPITKGETYKVITDDTSNVFCGFYTETPTTSSTTYDSTYYNDTESIYFTAPITGFVAFRTTANYIGHIYNANLISHIIPEDSINLLSIPDKDETTINGVTYSIKNGVFTFNGTCTESTTIYLTNTTQYDDVMVGMFGNISGYLSIRSWNSDWGGDSSPVYSNNFVHVDNSCNLRITVGAATYNNIQIKPMIVRSNTAPVYFHCYGRTPTILEKHNANILNIEDVADTTINGITYSIHNGVITLNGTATQYFYIVLVYSLLLNGTYYIYCFNRNTNAYVLCYNNSNGTWFDTNKSFTTTNSYKFRLDILGGATFTNYQIKPMLVKGSTAPTSFTPYHKNLLNIPDVEKNTVSGVTYYIKNGKIHLDGTATGNTNLVLYSGLNLTLQPGSYELSKFTTDLVNLYLGVSNLGTEVQASGVYPNQAVTITEPITVNYLRLWINQGNSFNDTVVSPMLVYGDTIPSYFETYDNNNKFEDIKQERHSLNGVLDTENLLQLPDRSLTTTNGLRYSVKDGILTLDGTATSTGFNIELGLFHFKPGTYYIKDFSSDTSKLYCYVNYGGWQSNRKLTITEDTTLSVFLRVGSLTEAISDFKVRPMLVRGSSEPSEFKAYSDNNIVKKIENLGYDLSLGLDDHTYNYIDFENKKAIIKCAKVDLGTLSWVKQNTSSDSTYTWYKASGVPFKENSDFLTTLSYPHNQGGYTNTISTAYKSVGFTIITSNYVDNLDGFTSAMSGHCLVYELATPVEIDLSDILTSDTDNLLKVDSYETLGFETLEGNLIDNEVPYKLTYQYKGTDLMEAYNE